MSRIGKMVIAIPQGVDVQLNNKTVSVKGSLGSLKYDMESGIECKIENNIITIINTADENDKKYSSLHGLSRALIKNMIIGVSSGYKKDLEIVGVGYRAVQKEKKVEFFVGYSHTIVFDPPAGINIKVLEPTKIEVTGIDKQLVGQVAANIWKLRPPEPYKGKGIRYKNQYVKRKAGKAGKA
jgi:large subunit ribosomal protein L6